MKNKKAFELPQYVVGFAIAMIVLVVVVFIFRSGIGKEKDILEEQIDSFGDCDKDGVQNFLDKCPCIAFEEGNENLDARGCPAGTPATKCTEEQITACKENE